MKTIKATIRMALAVALPLLFFATVSRAQEPTNTAVGIAKENSNAAPSIVLQKGDNKITISGELGGHPLDLPKEVLDRLSPEQIVELEKSRHQSSQLEDVVVPVCFFGAAVAVVYLVIALRLKRNRLLHETMRTMIEKGQPIPPELLQPHEPKRRPKSDLRSGLVLIAIGIALLVMFYHLGGASRAAGLIPLLMGVAFLVTWKVEANKNGDSK
jgi:hypothetical protein